jgi:DNA-binding GntR family transcriptional regulator
MKGDESSGGLFVTSAEKTYQAILKKILSGELAPGARLVRRTLAEALGVSPIPVLEALKRLEQDGLVEYRARWGNIVAVPTKEKVRDMFVFREAIECQVSRILSVSATASQAESLRALAADLDRVRYESEDPLLVTDFHYRLHMAMAEAAGVDSLTAALSRINFFWLLCKGAQHRKSKSELQRYWHTALIETVLTDGPEAADRAMREHIRDSFVPFIEAFEGGREIA